MNADETAPGKPPTGALVRRTLVSLVLPVLFVWGEHVPGPGIDVAALKSPDVPFQVVSPFALGVTPLLSAYVFVELCALLRKPWRTLRHDWPRGRAQLERVAWALALVFAAFQVFGVTQLLLTMPSSIAILAPSQAFVFGLSMLAGSAVAMLMARAISQQGLVNGIMLFALIDAGERLVSAPHPDWVVGCAGAALGIATWVVLPRESRRDCEQLQLVPSLTSTFHPPVVASSLLALPGALAAVGGSSVAAFTEALSDPAGLLVALSLLTLLVGLALSLLFQLPRQVAALAPPSQASPERAMRALKAALPATLLYLACAAFVFAACEARHFALASLVAPLVALTLDCIANCRLAREDLVCIHEERRPSRLEAIRERLCAAHVTHFIVDHNQLVGLVRAVHRGTRAGAPRRFEYGTRTAARD